MYPLWLRLRTLLFDKLYFQQCSLLQREVSLVGVTTTLNCWYKDKYLEYSYGLYRVSKMSVVDLLQVREFTSPEYQLDFQYQAWFPFCWVGLKFQQRSVGYHQGKACARELYPWNRSSMVASQNWHGDNSNWHASVERGPLTRPIPRWRAAGN